MNHCIDSKCQQGHFYTPNKLLCRARSIVGSTERQGGNVLDVANVDGDARTFKKINIPAIDVSVVRVYLFFPRVSCRRGQGGGAVGKGNLLVKSGCSLLLEDTSAREGITCLRFSRVTTPGEGSDSSVGSSCWCPERVRFCSCCLRSRAIIAPRLLEARPVLAGNRVAVAGTALPALVCCCRSSTPRPQYLLLTARLLKGTEGLPNIVGIKLKVFNIINNIGDISGPRD